MNRVRVIVIDEHPAVRQGLVRLLESTPDIEVIATVASPEGAVDAATTSNPAVVVLDLLLQPLGVGTALMRRIVRPPVAAKVLALAGQEEQRLAQVAAEAGAAAFLSKSASLDTLVATIRSLGGAEEPPIARRAVDQPSTAQVRIGMAQELGAPRVRLLRHLAAGFSNRTIAQFEGVSERTVKRRISDLYLKLGTSHRAGAVAVAMQHGLI